MVRRASLFVLAVLVSTGIAHADDPAKTANDPDKAVCKRQTVTGSLAQSKRECHTRAEWQQLGEQNREEARRAQQSGAAPGGTGH